MILITSYQLLNFTDWVHLSETRYFYGWVHGISIALMVLVNQLFIYAYFIKTTCRVISRTILKLKFLRFLLNKKYNLYRENK